MTIDQTRDWLHLLAAERPTCTNKLYLREAREDAERAAEDAVLRALNDAPSRYSERGERRWNACLEMAEVNCPDEDREELRAIVAEASSPQSKTESVAMTDQQRIGAALEIAMRFSQIDGAHHKAWAIDQMVRALTGDGYTDFVRDHEDGEDGPDTYSWDEGVAP